MARLGGKVFVDAQETQHQTRTPQPGTWRRLGRRRRPSPHGSSTVRTCRRAHSDSKRTGHRHSRARRRREPRTRLGSGRRPRSSSPRRRCRATLSRWRSRPIDTPHSRSDWSSNRRRRRRGWSGGDIADSEWCRDRSAHCNSRSPGCSRPATRGCSLGTSGFRNHKNHCSTRRARRTSHRRSYRPCRTPGPDRKSRSRTGRLGRRKRRRLGRRIGPLFGRRLRFSTPRRCCRPRSRRRRKRRAASPGRRPLSRTRRSSCKASRAAGSRTQGGQESPSVHA